MKKKIEEKNKKCFALFPSERDKVCLHNHVHYRGQIPETGPVICSMCGKTWNTMKEAKKEGAGQPLKKGGYMKRLSDKYIGTISSGTVWAEDIIIAIENFFSSLHEEEFPEIIKEYLKLKDNHLKDLTVEDEKFCEKAVNELYLQEELIPLMNEISPEGTYFGAHEGDGADIGFHQYLMDEDDSTFWCNECGRIHDVNNPKDKCNFSEKRKNEE